MFQEGWYVIYTASRMEKKLANALQQAGFSTYLPMIKEMRQWSDRKRRVVVPLFRSYVFVHLSHDGEYLRAVQHKGASFFVKTKSGQPAILFEKEIVQIKKIITSDFRYEVSNDKIPLGYLCRVKEGAMKGFIGESVQYHGKNLVVLRMEQLGQHILVHIPASQLESLESLSLNEGK